MELLKEFSGNQSIKLVKVFKQWESENLVIQIGKRESSVQDTYGLPYTSSGLYAGLWNTNTQSVYVNDNSMQFDGIGYIEDLTPVALFTKLDEEGNEIDDNIVIEMKI